MSSETLSRSDFDARRADARRHVECRQVLLVGAFGGRGGLWTSQYGRSD